jgi:hypothetical protein
MNEKRLENLFKYFELLTKAYFTDDPLDVKPSIQKIMLLIELEINKGFGQEVKHVDQD